MKEKKKTKKTFHVSEFDSLSDCLDQMAKERYQPVRRMEKPVFREGPAGPEPAGQEIVFEGRLIEE